MVAEGGATIGVVYAAFTTFATDRPLAAMAAFAAVGPAEGDVSPFSGMGTAAVTACTARERVARVVCPAKGGAAPRVGKSTSTSTLRDGLKKPHEYIMVAPSRKEEKRSLDRS